MGVDRLYVADNGSTDATPVILERIAAADRRVRVTPAPGPFRQPEIMKALWDEAVSDGAGWVLPSDADEFIGMGGAALRAHCAAAEGIGGFKLRVRNFVQFRHVLRDGPGTLETMVAYGRPHGRAEDGMELVSSGALPFVRMNYPAKLLLRGARTVTLERGQHRADGLDGALAALPLCDMLHAPIRSRDDLATRVRHAARSHEVAPDPGTSWHLKRLAPMDRAGLDVEWRLNSIHPAWPWRRGFGFDLRLRRLAVGLREFRRRALDGLAARR